MRPENVVNQTKEPVVIPANLDPKEDNPEPNDARWAGLFEKNRLMSKGMKLGFVSPIIKDGQQIVELQKSKIEKMNEKWEAVVVLYVVGDTPTIATITRSKQVM